jgi:hypothetical protein
MRESERGERAASGSCGITPRLHTSAHFGSLGYSWLANHPSPSGYSQP